MRPGCTQTYSEVMQDKLFAGSRTFHHVRKLNCQMRTLAAYICALAIGFAIASTPAHAALTYLHAQGEDIVNESGQKILLRGVGLGNWMLPEGYMWKFGDGGDRPRKIERI